MSMTQLGMGPRVPGPLPPLDGWRLAGALAMWRVRLRNLARRQGWSDARVRGLDAAMRLRHTLLLTTGVLLALLCGTTRACAGPSDLFLPHVGRPANWSTAAIPARVLDVAATAVVGVYPPYRRCTGTLMASGHVIRTAKHCWPQPGDADAGGGLGVVVDWREGTPRQYPITRVVFATDGADVADVVTATPLPGLGAIECSARVRVESRAAVWSVGFGCPAGHDYPLVHPGMVVVPALASDGGNAVVVTDPQVCGGDSGGPVLLQSGCVWGLVQGYYTLPGGSHPASVVHTHRGKGGR